ncbi:hypothetical protein CRUP_017052 [Coryphaenoides rupestris]|nr:hypothetical protein CRUP_017052 [Coryphaenoides rupestris]
MLCSALRKQMTYLETQQNDAQTAKEESRRLKTKLKTYESLDRLLQGQREEVESMVSDMGVSQAAVEQLSIYCISLKKEYDNLKGSLRSSNDMCEKLKKEMFTSNNKLQKSSMEVSRTKEDTRALQKDLANADKEISLKQPQLHQPSDCQDIDLNMTFDVTTPDDTGKRHAPAPLKKMRLDPTGPSVSRHKENNSAGTKGSDAESAMDAFFRNSLLFRKKKTFGSMLEPQRAKAGTSPISELRPLMKAKRKHVTRPPTQKSSSCLTLDNFLE